MDLYQNLLSIDRSCYVSALVKRASWPVSVASVGPVAVGVTLWKVAGQTMVTTIVKMTLSIPEDGPLTLVDPEPILTTDEHEGGQPTGTLVGACETAPLLQRVDVLLTGHARAPEGATQTTVRLMIAGDGGTLLDKTLAVSGDCDESGTAQPFRKLKLGYERAFGGIGYADNPLGTGFGSSTSKPPNIVYPTDPAERTAGFGAIPASFPVRKKLLGDVPRSALAQRVVTIPQGFDWSYFQAAPEDQRVEMLRGNEWLLLDGLHPQKDRLRIQLPGATAVAKIYGHDRAGAPDTVPLRIDMLQVDADALRCSLVWRGSFPVTSVELLSEVIIAGGVETPDEPMLWPETAADPEDVLEPADQPPSGSGGGLTGDQTVQITTDGEQSADALFGGTVAMDADSVAAQTLPFADRAKDRKPAKARPQTDDPAVLPFKSASDRPVSGPPVVVPPDHPFESTVAIDANQIPDPERSPFAIAPAGSRASGGGTAQAIPGAPWAKPGTAGGEGEDVAQPALVEPVPVPAQQQEEAQQEAALAAEDEARLAAEQQAKLAAEGQAKLEAEQQAKLELERQAKLAAEQQAKLAAEQQAAAEAEERRRTAVEKFQKEQEEARNEQQQRAAEQSRAKRKAAKTLRQDMYGAFKRKK